MSDFTSYFRSTRVGILRMCSGLIFVGLVVVAHKAQSNEGSFAHDLEIFTVQPTYSGTLAFPYQAKTDVAFSRPDNTGSVESGGRTLRLSLVAETKGDTTWSKNAHWQIAHDSSRVSLSPILRLESKGARFEIKPRRHSIWVVWRKAFD